MKNRIVAVGLLTQDDLDVLGPAFERAYPIDESPCFAQLLQAIDDVDRARFSGDERFVADPKTNS